MGFNCILCFKWKKKRRLTIMIMTFVSNPVRAQGAVAAPRRGMGHLPSPAPPPPVGGSAPHFSLQPSEKN